MKQIFLPPKHREGYCNSHCISMNKDRPPYIVQMQLTLWIVIWLKEHECEETGYTHIKSQHSKEPMQLEGSWILWVEVRGGRCSKNDISQCFRLRSDFDFITTHVLLISV